jgi:carbon-monoxide dehydrogenase small subunit
MKKHNVNFTLNDAPVEITVEPNELLLNVLREKEHLTGSKYGCGIGECGACTVEVDGEATLSCLKLAVAVEGKSVTTIEGLADGNNLNPLQKSFLDNAAVQCGFCTPGMVMLGKELLDEKPHPTEGEVREHMRGALCRCTGYTGIVKAVMTANDKESK